MFCAGPLWIGWGMPWLMLVFPVAMLAFMFLACRFLRPRGASWCSRGPMPEGYRDEEVRCLRQELAELRREVNEGKKSR
ncbi:hypothetical protein [Anaeroselena agilis]|uniref:SHOCT domain-containing protein n=1 Tax=Anaeroselena agilis TaxID=3063788 RepID=A0ABU3NZF1_9FIRM|nr:hypothetical protein [Selenomonadales bacterium 4137-cl]